MRKQISKLALTAPLVLATTLTFTACEEKKKQDGTTTTEPTAAEETQEEAAAKREAYIKANGGTFIDSRDKKTYKTIKIGEQVWMAENLNYETEEGSDCYDIKPDNCQKYGRLYDWETAMEACPDGWHLPSSAEWQTLVDLVGGEKIAGKKLKAISVNGTDNFGFSALLGGAMEINLRYNTDSVGTDGKWWSSSKVGDSFIPRIMFYDSDVNIDGSSNISEAISVRCIQGEAKQAKAEAATFTVCEEKAGGGNIKLLEAITYDDGDVQKFEYDEQNRIVKINNETITYADNLVTVGTQKFVIKGNTVTVDNESFTIDKDGYIVERNGAEYKYKDGNLIEMIDVIDGGSSYFYDDKKSPFSNSNTPKWLMSLVINIHYTSGGTESLASKNNVSSYLFQGGAPGGCDSKYVYDKDEFPVTNTRTCRVDDAKDKSIIRYTYRCGK